MIEAYSTNVTVESGSTVPLNNVIRVTGKSTDVSGSGTIELNGNGVYIINVSASVVANAGGIIQLQLYKDGSAISEAVAFETASDTSGIHNLSFMVPIRITQSTCCCWNVPVQITLVNAGVSVTVNIVSVMAYKAVS